MTDLDVQTALAPDGIELAYRRLEGTGDLIVAIHGFTGDGTTMFPLVDEIRNGRPALLVDVVGHGRSEAPTNLEHYAMSSVVDQILSLIGPHQPETVHLIGYSMGGRIAFSMAARAPWYFASVTTLSATPGIEDPVDRASRYDSDQAQANKLEEVGLETFIDEWLALSLFEPYRQALSAEALEQTVAQRLQNTSVGLANSLRGTGTGSMPPVWNALASIRSPLLTVAGGLDERYVDIARAVADAAPFGRCEVIDGVGHVVHQENLSAVAAVVHAFLAECGSDEDL